MSVLDTGCKSHYVFTPCCGGTPVKFCRNTPPALLDGATFLYTGNDIVGYGGTLVSGQCYTVSVVNQAANFPSIFAEVQAGNFIRATSQTPCNDEICPTCPKKIVFKACCDSSVIEFTIDENYDIPFERLYQYTGDALVFGSGGVLIPNGCYLVEIVNTTEEESLSLPTPPPSEEVVLAGRTCTDFYEPAPFCAPCTKYYQIINCADEDEFYCTTSNLSLYINNLIEDSSLWPVIQTSQFPDKCFFVLQVPVCDAPVPVTVTSSYVGCAACQETIVVYYELINCNNPEVIVYTSTDLSEYVGKYITIDEYAGECFYVTVASGLVPSDIPVTPTGDTYEDCAECTAQHYILRDCTRQLPDFVTTTDLSEQVGSVIVISTCPETCWEVEETDITVVDGPISPVGQYEDCPECLRNLFPVNCFEFSLTGEYPEANVTVWLPDGTEQSIDLNDKTLASIKGCYLTWIAKDGIVTKEFGLCVDNECPLPPRPKRKVTPGYDTPACTPEYYEKVECNFSEWMYKDVLEKRYGISNCCPEELMKWEIKHEMLMLDSLVNPDYDCQPPIDCGCPQPTTCNCSCNSGN